MMSNPPKSLAARLDWGKVLLELGIDDGRRILPKAMKCPLCGDGSMKIMEDQVLGGAWFFCFKCLFAGDVIELVAMFRECDLDQAIELLELREFFEADLKEDDIASYRSQHVEYRHRLREFWKSAQSEPLLKFKASGRMLMRRIAMFDTACHGLWSTHHGQLFGAAHKNEIEELFAPYSYQPQVRSNHQEKSSKRRGPGPGKRRLFEGHDWDDFVIIPHSDLPGRIIGFTFIGRDGNTDQGDIIFKRGNLGCCSQRPRESGFAWLDVLHRKSNPAFSGTVFIFTEILQATLLHARHLRDSRIPLPILAVRSSRDFQPLNLPPEVAERTIVFCGPPNETIPLAKRFGGMVSDYELSEASMERGLSGYDSLFQLRQFRNHAIPWQAALGKQLTQLNGADVEMLIVKLGLTPDECRSLRGGFDIQTDKLWENYDPSQLSVNRVRVGGQTVVERPEGWFIEETGEKICNYPLRVERIITTEAGKTYLNVRVERPEQPLELYISEEIVKKKSLFETASNGLREKTGDLLNYQKRKWAKESLFIAREFGQPKILTHAGRVGYWADQRCYQFPHYAINLTGGILSDPIPREFYEEPLPGNEFASPENNRQAVMMLSMKTPQTQILWALAVCVLQHLLAGRGCREQGNGIILDGEFAHKTGEMAAIALGCNTASSSQRGNRSHLDFVSSTCMAHDIPTLIQFGHQSRVCMTTSWLDDIGIRKAILQLSSYAALAVSSHLGFVRIHAYESPQPLGMLSRHARWVIPRYLRDVCQRKHQINIWAQQRELLALLDDIADWFHRDGGDPEAVTDAASMLNFDYVEPERSFFELLLRMKQEGDIAWCHRDEYRSDLKSKSIAVIEPNIGIREDSGVRIFPGVINQVLKRKRAPSFAVGVVRERLQSLSVLQGCEQFDGGESWLLDYGWWAGCVGGRKTCRHFRGELRKKYV
ncbi:hypothetical protein [Gimesia sp.]|uniref:hypothetical protein n=1 Tax=Gimesia sp. TaxID=2024833 RepID=UPI003A8D94C7